MTFYNSREVMQWGLSATAPLALIVSRTQGNMQLSKDMEIKSASFMASLHMQHCAEWLAAKSFKDILINNTYFPVPLLFFMLSCM